MSDILKFPFENKNIATTMSLGSIAVSMSSFVYLNQRINKLEEFNVKIKDKLDEFESSINDIEDHLRNTIQEVNPAKKNIAGALSKIENLSQQ